ncbi:MAG: hypothetical protein E2P02_06400 [Acidobacteria bacterium]|nr:MAG: hypothetical protein E2P02_06400 [Acidobacteriota bacterium]
MTTPNTYAKHEAARQARVRLANGVEQDAWVALLKPACSGSSGVVTLVSGYGPILLHVGSSSFVVDRRPLRQAGTMKTPRVSVGFHEVVALPIVDQMKELLASCR